MSLTPTGTTIELDGYRVSGGIPILVAFEGTQRWETAAADTDDLGATSLAAGTLVIPSTSVTDKEHVRLAYNSKLWDFDDPRTTLRQSGAGSGVYPEVAGGLAFWKDTSTILYLLSFNKTPANIEIIGQARFYQV